MLDPCFSPDSIVLLWFWFSGPLVEGQGFSITLLMYFSNNSYQCKYCLVVYWDYHGDLVYCLLRFALKMQLSMTS